MGNVFLRAREKVVDANDIMTVGQQSFAKMRSQKPGPARDEGRFPSHWASLRRDFYIARHD
jgi:hypothetical protein